MGRAFADCPGLAITLPYEGLDKDVHDLWQYIIDVRGVRSLFSIAIDELLGIDDIGIAGIEKLVSMSYIAMKSTARRFVPIAGQVLLAADIAKTAKEWNADVEEGFCNVMQLMNAAYWDMGRRHVKMSDWEKYPAYLALIIYYGRSKDWSPMKISQVMVSAGWLPSSEANDLRNEMLKGELLKIDFKSQIDALEFEDSLEIEDDSVAIVS
jgi:hypothetical protein